MRFNFLLYISVCCYCLFSVTAEDPFTTEPPVFFAGVTDALREANENTTAVEEEAPVEAPVAAPVAATQSPTFKEGDAPTVFVSETIVQPVFVAPVAPPPISGACERKIARVAIVATILVALGF